MIIFIIITGLFLHSTSAVKVQYLTLFKPKMTLQLGTRNIIPCSFHTKRQLNPLKVELEWGKIPVGKDKYVPLIRLKENQVTTPSPDLLDLYDLFVSEISRGNCSLVIRHTTTQDSGTYMVRLKVKGKLFEPVPSIKIRVMNLQTRTSQATISHNRGNDARNLKGKNEEPTATTTKITTTTTKITTTTTQITTTLPTTVTSINGGDFISWYILPKLNGNETVALIIVLVVGAILTAFSVLGVVAWVLYFKLRKKVPLGDVENPVETTPIASSNGKNKELTGTEVEKAPSEKAENEEESDGEEEVEEEEMEEEEVEEEEVEEEEVEEQ